MTIPKYFEIKLPILEILSSGNDCRPKDLVGNIAEKFNLTEEEQNQMYESGNGPILYDRITWALTHLNFEGLVFKPSRGRYRISPEGQKVISTPESLNSYEAKRRVEGNSKLKTTITEIQNIETPTEMLWSSFLGIKTSIYSDIIDILLSKTPRDFEKIVVMLLQKMGYGGEIEDSGFVTQYTNDKGIDGIIKEDVLGFGRVCIQAKLYKSDVKVQRDDIQRFFGALAPAQSQKGVVITTSDFTKGAYDYVDSLNSGTKIVLINGQKLAGLIYDYNLGLQIERTVEIKKIDEEFWTRFEEKKSIL
jgi:restriction system protein